MQTSGKLLSRTGRAGFCNSPRTQRKLAQLVLVNMNRATSGRAAIRFEISQLQLGHYTEHSDVDLMALKVGSHASFSASSQ
jgi:hypothetical protein